MINVATRKRVQNQQLTQKVDRPRTARGCWGLASEKGYKNNNSHKKLIGLGLRGAVGVWRVEEIVDSEQHLLDRDGGPPTLVLVEDAGGREHFEFEGKGTRGLI